MGKTKTKSRTNSKDILRSTNTPLVKSVLPSQRTTEDLVAEAAKHLEQSQPEQGLPLVQEALKRLESDKEAYTDVDILLQAAAREEATFPTTLVLGADICLALGDVARARTQYEMAVQIDPHGALVSAEPYLQLAQLCEEGGQKSIDYFDKAIEVMKNEIDVLDEEVEIEGTQEIVSQRRLKVADALSGMAEVYMTDLSWEEDAEQRCEQLVTEAVAVCPEELSAGTLQTLASVRISQERMEEARQALSRSLALWKEIPADVDSLARPEFATRISLVRLLMEVEQEQDAIEVLEGLTKEDDQSVEAWYLGGWCHVLLSQRQGSAQDARLKNVEQAREWLGTCLKLYKIQDYEDERLKHHADELVQQLNQALDLPDGADDWETDDEKDDDDVHDADEIIEIEAVDTNGADVEMT